MPLYRRLPKRGFKNPFRKEYNPINLDVLNAFEAGTVVTPELLDKAGLLRKTHCPVKILGRGQLEKAIAISAHQISKTAMEAVEKAGGKFERIQ